MTTATAKLQFIQTGDASAEEAMKALREVVEAHGVKGANAIRTALRAWTWKAMQTRRADAELRDWYRVIRTTSGLLEKVDGRASAYLEALAHLVEESVRHAEARPRTDLLKRAHVATILEYVAKVGGRIERARLAEEIDVSNSRLSQILTELTVAGALERSGHGRRAIYELASSGTASLLKRALGSGSSIHATRPNVIDNVEGDLCVANHRPELQGQ